MGEKVINGVIIKKHITNNDENRKILLDISEDATEAFISIVYEDKKADVTTGEKVEPTIYSIGELREALMKMGITYGIFEENLVKCTKENRITDLLIARGIKAENDEDDVINVSYQSKREKNKFEADHTGRVDYRNMGEVTAVCKGDIIATLITGKEGNDGVDVYGKTIARKKKKKLMLKAGEGCVVKDGNQVEALIDGEPYFKSNTFYVYGVHTLNKDVSLETGDLVFIGDIKVFGNVKEGMKVDAGNSVTIDGNTENCNISAKGDISISGNSIMTTVTAGGKDMKIYKYISILEEARDLLTMLTDAVMALKKDTLIGSRIVDGEMIKKLMETKFTELPKRCWGILRESFEMNNGEPDPLADLIKSKLIGVAPLQIKHFSELEIIINQISERIEELGTTLTLPVNIKMGYCQDCNVQSSGDITIIGSGEYVSNLIADRGIYFIRDGSIARGGVLKANSEIICKVVGSQGGVKTKLVVPRSGHIKIDLAYQNTIVSVGGREFVIDVPSTNVHAYMNADRELMVDRFRK